MKWYSWFQAIGAGNTTKNGGIDMTIGDGNIYVLTKEDYDSSDNLKLKIIRFNGKNELPTKM